MCSVSGIFGIFWPQSAQLRFPTTIWGPQGERCFSKIYRPEGGETLGDPGLTFATPESILKVRSHDAANERNLRTDQFVLRNPTSCSFKAPSRSSQREKMLEGQRGGERRMSWTRTCHFKPRFTLNQLKEKRILYLKEEINREREQKKVK